MNECQVPLCNSGLSRINVWRVEACEMMKVANWSSVNVHCPLRNMCLICEFVERVSNMIPVVLSSRVKSDIIDVMFRNKLDNCGAILRIFCTCWGPAVVLSV